MTPKEFFDKCGVKPTRFKEGLLLTETGKYLDTDVWAKLRNVPRCGKEYDYAYQTCFCETEQELMIALSTASQVANYIFSSYNAAGYI